MSDEVGGDLMVKPGYATGTAVASGWRNLNAEHKAMPTFEAIKLHSYDVVTVDATYVPTMDTKVGF